MSASRPLPRALPAACSALLAAACSAPPAAAPGPEPAAAPAAATWPQAMQRVGELRQRVAAECDAGPAGDLRAVAIAAAEAAALLREGYGRHEDPRVPGFARLARDAEAWLLQVALEARQDRADLAAAVFREGERRHCSRCHEAARPLYRW